MENKHTLMCNIISPIEWDRLHTTMKFYGSTPWTQTNNRKAKKKFIEIPKSSAGCVHVLVRYPTHQHTYSQPHTTQKPQYLAHAHAFLCVDKSSQYSETKIFYVLNPSTSVGNVDLFPYFVRLYGFFFFSFFFVGDVQSVTALFVEL